MPNKRIPLALIGYGGAGSGIHAPLIEFNDTLELATIVTQGATRLDAARRRFPNARVSDSVAATEGCQVAVVALPILYRGDVVEGLLKQDMHVVLEKPFASDLESARRLFATGGERLTVFHNRRWDSDYLTLKRLRDEDAWSGPARLTSRIFRWQPSVREGWRNEAAGGGYLREVGPHQIDQAVELLGPVQAVYAEVSARRSGARAEDDVFLSLYHEDGSISRLETGALGNPDAPRFELSSRQTFISIGSSDPQQSQLASGMTPADPGWGVPNSSNWVIRSGAESVTEINASRGWWPSFYDGVANWVAGHAAPVTAADGVMTMQIIDAALRSSRESKVVPIRDL